ncbi:hypothetical protein BDW22DRAFT_1425305 [Trametopsis cervina]|nr:hypothetical protein BDW22DRAFT_1425305 [Trametopsis cervina]
MSRPSTPQKPLDALGAKRPSPWRKPVPNLIPDPPKRHHSISRASSFRHLTLLPSNEPQPPMPSNYQEIIDMHTGTQQRVERPASPTPPHGSQEDVSAPQGGAPSTRTQASTRVRRPRREDKALPTLPDARSDRRLSDAGSTSTTSTRVEPSPEPVADAWTRSPRATTSRLADVPQPRPAGPQEEQRDAHTSVDAEFFHGPYNIVYPSNLNSSKLEVTRRHVAVFPTLPRYKRDNDNVSTDMTAMETLDDARSERHPYASSVMLGKVEGPPPVRELPHVTEPEDDLGCMHCVNHIFRRLFPRRVGSIPNMRY